MQLLQMKRKTNVEFVANEDHDDDDGKSLLQEIIDSLHLPSPCRHGKHRII